MANKDAVLTSYVRDAVLAACTSGSPCTSDTALAMIRAHNEIYEQFCACTKSTQVYDIRWKLNVCLEETCNNFLLSRTQDLLHQPLFAVAKLWSEFSDAITAANNYIFRIANCAVTSSPAVFTSTHVMQSAFARNVLLNQLVLDSLASAVYLPESSTSPIVSMVSELASKLQCFKEVSDAVLQRLETLFTLQFSETYEFAAEISTKCDIMKQNGMAYLWHLAFCLFSSLVVKKFGQDINATAQRLIASFQPSVLLDAWMRMIASIEQPDPHRHGRSIQAIFGGVFSTASTVADVVRMTNWLTKIIGDNAWWASDVSDAASAILKQIGSDECATTYAKWLVSEMKSIGDTSSVEDMSRLWIPGVPALLKALESKDVFLLVFHRQLSFAFPNLWCSNRRKYECMKSNFVPLLTAIVANMGKQPNLEFMYADLTSSTAQDFLVIRSNAWKLPPFEPMKLEMQCFEPYCTQIAKFEAAYRLQHSGRNLKWITPLATATLTVRLNKRSTVTVSFPQLAVISAIDARCEVSTEDDQAKRVCVTAIQSANEIAEISDMPLHLVDTALTALRKCKLVVDTLRGLTINQAFSAAAPLNISNSKDAFRSASTTTAASTSAFLAVERATIIQAAMIRVLKQTRKFASASDLFAATVASRKFPFSVTRADIDQNITHLESHEYLTIQPDSSILYMA